MGLVKEAVKGGDEREEADNTGYNDSGQSWQAMANSASYCALVLTTPENSSLLLNNTLLDF